MNTIQFDTINNVKRYHTGYFFSDANMKFHKSKVYENVIKTDKFHYFVTSEKNIGQAKRLYTIRLMRENGQIEAFLGFQNFNTKKQAERTLAKMFNLKNFYA